MSDPIKLTVPGYNQYGHFDRNATIPEVVAWLQEQGATIEEVGEPGYYDHHGNDGEFVAPGRYLVYRLDDA